MGKFFAEEFAEMQRERDAKELTEILKKTDLTPQEIWEITPDNFYAWQKIHYTPKIIAHFHEKLNGFDDWLKESKLTGDDLINQGISKFVNAST